MQVQNPEVGMIARDQAGLTIAEGFPQSLSSQIIPVINLTPEDYRLLNIKSSGSSVSATSNTIFTTSAERDTYIVGIVYSFVKDATCDVATGFSRIQTTIDGVSGSVLARFALLTLTAQNQTTYIKFPRPVKVNRNVAVQLAQDTFTAGTFARYGTVYYFEK